MNALVYPCERFLNDYRALRARGPGAGMRISTGRFCAADGTILLVSSSSAPAARLQLWVQLANEPSGILQTVPAEIDGALYLGQGTELGTARGLIRMESGLVELVNELHLVGPGMEKIRLVSTTGANRKAADEAVRAPTQGVDFSRVEGALGTAGFRRLSNLRFAFVGAGRLGSTLATMLARDGVSHFTLIDPDIVEAHNLAGGLGGIVADIGARKVEALANSLQAANPAIEVDLVPASVTHWRALELIAKADVIVSTPDHDSARLAAAWLSALYLKPLLDTGAGLFRDNTRREIGADVRLVWPGRCLLCAGGLRAEPEARRVLASAEAERFLRETPPDWRHQRAGSLASLNALTASLGARLIEDFVEGIIVENGFWTRLEFDNDGRLQVAFPEPSAASSHLCCCRFAGLGDDGLKELIRSVNR